MTFFNSDIVQEELHRMQELYLEINKMGLLLSVDQKKEQLDKMIELIDLQQTMYMRVTLSDDPDAQKMVSQVREAARMVGCLLYTSPSPRDLSTSRMPSSA